MRRCSALHCYKTDCLHVVACDLMKELEEKERKEKIRKRAENKAVNKMNSIIFRHTGLR